MKILFKSMLNIFATILVIPLYLAYFICSFCCEQRASFPFYSQSLSLIPGLFGVYLRRAFYRLALTDCSDDVWISFGTVFSSPKVSLGSHVYIGQYCIIGEATIGRNSILASRVSITSGLKQHGYDSINKPIREQEGVYTKIVIGDDCWLGEGAIVAADIGSHSIVGAGSVVVKEVVEKVIVAGNPAVITKER